MSGIYGAVSGKSVNKSLYKGLAIWNDSYGDLPAQEFSQENAFLGIKPEDLKDSENDRRVFSEDGKVGVFDALIYSDKKTHDTDEYYLFKNVSSEGAGSLKEINGDFAGAVFDTEKNELMLVRDHMGVRPLFYYADEDRVIFSTDIRGILSATDVDTAVNEKWLYAKLSGSMNLPVTCTEYEHIKCVPPGGSVIFSLKGTVNKTEDRYYIPGSRKIRLKNREAYTKELRRLVEDAVRIRAEATKKPLGAELSGGLDSGVIDLILAKMNKDCLYYSWTPGEEELPLAERDERLVIKDICDKAGITCNYGGLSVKWNDDSLVAKRTPLDMTRYTDIHHSVKYAFPLYINTPQIFETASFMKGKGVKMIFTGHGGDEGVSHRSNPYELWYYHEYYRYLRLMYSRSSIDKHRIKKTIELIRQNMQMAENKLKKPFVAEHHANDITNQDFAGKYDKESAKPLNFSYDPVSYVREGGSRNRLDVLAYYSACTGVRYLIPFLDYRVLDYALGIPRYLYHNWYYNRFIFREAFKDLMPLSLYKQRLKEDTSYYNLPQKEKEKAAQPDRRSRELIELRRKNLNYLNKDYWKQYLDYELLEKWVDGENDPEYDGRIYGGLFECIRVELLVKRAREVNEN